MRLVLEEVENGYIIEEDTELAISGSKVLGKKYVFASLDDAIKFITEFYTKRPNKNTPPRKKKDEP